MYESLRKTILDSRESNGAELLSSLGLTFSVTLSAEEGGKVHELKEGGGNISVTPGNVYEYAKLYAELRMVEVCRESLEVGPCDRMWVWLNTPLPSFVASVGDAWWHARSASKVSPDFTDGRRSEVDAVWVPSY